MPTLEPLPAAATGLPRPDGSRVVLIGVSDYETMEPLPAVGENLASMERILTDADLWGLPSQNCTTLCNPASVADVLDAVHAAASAATEALVVYFAGHGLLDERSDLYLALSGADRRRIYKAVRYDDIRREVIDTARRCYGKVVILDCCFSGRALKGGMSGSTEMADHARVDGTYLMTAAAETSVALAPPGDTYTAFTGALVDKLSNGLPDGPDFLDMETLFYHVRAEMQARNFPIPQQRTRNDGRAIALVRNRRGARSNTIRRPSAQARKVPTLPAEFDAALRWPPGELARQVRALRELGRDAVADQLLAASASARAGQEVAAIIDMLVRHDQGADLTIVVQAASGRPPVETLDVIDALHEIERGEQASALLAATAGGAAEDTADLGQLLRSRERTSELTNLLDAAVDAAQRKGSLISLIGALWLAGLRDDVDQLLQRAAGRLPESAVVALADELRAAGREPAAFSLYATAADAVATRPPDVIAQLCAAMLAAGQDQHRERTALAAIRGAKDPTAIVDLTQAFWATGQDDYAERTLSSAAKNLVISDVAAVAASLRDLSREQDAYQFCEQALMDRTFGDIWQLVADLREVGRPVDAKNLLETTARRESVDVVAALAIQREPADARRILATAVTRDRQEVAQLTKVLLSKDHTAAQTLAEVVIAMPVDRVSEICHAMTDYATTDLLLTSILATCKPEQLTTILAKLHADDAKRLFLLAIQGGHLSAELVVPLVKQRQPEDRGPNPMLAQLLDQPVDGLTPLLTALRKAGLGKYATAVRSSFATRSRDPERIAAAISALNEHNLLRDAEEILSTSLAGRSITELRDLIRSLDAYSLTSSISAVLDWVPNNHVPQGVTNLANMLNNTGLSHYAQQLTKQASRPTEPPSSDSSGRRTWWRPGRP